MYPDLRYGIVSAGQLRRRWRENDGALAPELVHVTTPGPLAWQALRAARAEGIATSADFRTNFHAYSRHYGMAWLEPAVLGYLRRLHAMADATFVPTHELALQLDAQGFTNLQVVARGVDAERFAPIWRDAGLRARWGAGEDDPVLLHVGRLAAEKNVQLALDAFERLRPQQPGLRMVVVGDGPLRERLQAAHPAVHFAGTQRGEALARHYASADVFLFPSLTDTFGNVTLEAMASGLAVVAYDTAAAGLHVHDGVSGWLAPLWEGRDGSEAFINAAHCALATARPQSAMRRHARQIARRCDWDSVLRSFDRRLRALANPVIGPSGHAALA